MKHPHPHIHAHTIITSITITVLSLNILKWIQFPLNCIHHWHYQIWDSDWFPSGRFKFTLVTKQWSWTRGNKKGAGTSSSWDRTVAFHCGLARHYKRHKHKCMCLHWCPWQRCSGRPLCWEVTTRPDWEQRAREALFTFGVIHAPGLWISWTYASTFMQAYPVPLVGYFGRFHSW